jgi:hypothetical protein
MFGEWTETDRLPHLIMKYRPCRKRSQGRTLKRPLDCEWERTRSRGLKLCKLYDDDDDDDDNNNKISNIRRANFGANKCRILNM